MQIVSARLTVNDLALGKYRTDTPKPKQGDGYYSGRNRWEYCRHYRPDTVVFLYLPPTLVPIFFKALMLTSQAGSLVEALQEPYSMSMCFPFV